MLSSELFPGVCSLNANVLEHCVCSMFIGEWGRTQCSETLEFKLQTPGNNPEESIRHSKHSESLKSTKTFVTVHRASIGPAFLEFTAASLLCWFFMLLA
jgi:hypothetical protein